jgi:HEPN domain-containing protein
MASRSADWLRQGRRDLDHARRAREDGDHEWACFAAHQGADKALKAVFPGRGEEAWGHALGDLVGALVRDPASDPLVIRAKALDKHYIPARYPNGFASGAPMDYYTTDDAPDPNAVAVYLFGSFARGTAVPGSDVDLLVVVDRDPRPPRDRIPDHLPGAFPVGVDVIVWTREEMEERLARHDRLARTVLGEGELLFERDPGAGRESASR